MFRLFVLLAAMAWGAVAHAQEFKVMGMGTRSCGRFIATVDKHPPGTFLSLKRADGELFSENTGYQQWLMGFVSGFNTARAGEELQQRITNTLDVAGIDLWMRNWCNKHPTKDVADGAIALIAELRSNADRSIWDK
jgi:hypothetical protein